MIKTMMTGRKLQPITNVAKRDILDPNYQIKILTGILMMKVPIRIRRKYVKKLQKQICPICAGHVVVVVGTVY